MVAKLSEVLTQINFVIRYNAICEEHNDFANRLDKTNKKELLSIFKKIKPNVKYETLDRLYTIGFKIENYNYEFTVKLHNGLIEPFFFIGNKEEKLIFNRFDFLCEEMDANFDRGKYNLAKYKNLRELEDILEKLVAIYEDYKEGFLASNENESKETGSHSCDLVK